MKLIIEADGGSRGNPGVAGSGTVVYDADRNVLREIAYVVGKRATNNVAEYHGMLRGLEAARELGASEVEIYLDSKLVVEQMSGRWKIKHPDMQKLAIEARKIMSTFDSVTFTWVPRAKNKAADALSNVAMDAAAAGHAPGVVGDESVGSASDQDPTVVPAAAGSAASAASAAQDDTTGMAADRSQPAANNPSHWTGASHPPTRFVLLRHGQTAMSVAKQYSGRSNPQLTELGLAQAKAAAEAIGERAGIDAVITSPLDRCRQTAELAAGVLGLEAIVHDDLIELDFGSWEGRTFQQAHAADPLIHEAWISDPSVTPPGGESLKSLDKRTRRIRRRLEADYAGRTVLVVSHVTPIKSFIRQAMGAGPKMFSRVFLDLASISVVEFFAEDARVDGCVRVVNDTAHLRRL
ncbi:bifunctional RNase H/acid phosphatase [Corynebacterium halotolerans]|uniref:Bifunctional RNase H/acid phosphatase n=1 Tax=Corynebacterium halotolerans YIM 70093 = DSM 44683 TaxID=1121362 RepID=M1P8L5_9CORY|nr:bifunctional RNase H/acid phosphatase [Corynebacterium halotolerans]AGF72996.1 bifunctional RNase H/acid phosphatase [Corynebacterium halotolerans YIM 70093 = DSM 44683]